MNTFQMREDIKALERQLVTKKNDLYYAESCCIHKWGDPKDDHIVTPAYRIPEEKGSSYDSYRSELYVPAKTTKQWRRECSTCGKVEYTTNVIEEVKKIYSPRF